MKSQWTPAEIYSERYAPQYEALFINHPLWAPKLRCNVALLRGLLQPLGNWVDTCCGQGWHLAQFPRHKRQGIDISGAQLERARRRNPGVPFIQADIAEYEFPEEQRFDLVSNFWSSYSYLNDENAIRSLALKLVRWTAPGGALYLELTVPELLAVPLTIATSRRKRAPGSPCNPLTGCGGNSTMPAASTQ